MFSLIRDKTYISLASCYSFLISVAREQKYHTTVGASLFHFLTKILTQHSILYCCLLFVTHNFTSFHFFRPLQLFLFNVILDYLTDDEELAVVERYTTRMDIPEVTAVSTPEQIRQFQALVRQVPVAESVSRFAVNLVRATRPDDPLAPDVVKRYVQYGASVRATMFVTLAAKARALMAGRYHVTQDDITALALPVLRHRVLTNYFAESDKVDVDDVLTQLIETFGDSGRAAQAG